MYWIGGGSGAGKSTIARRLAAEHGLQLYVTDDVMARHAATLTAADAPELARFQAMTMDQRWLDRSPATMLDTFHWFRGEGFAPIVDDLERLPAAPPAVAEGFRLLPRLVAPLLTDPGRAVWLLPTPEFRRAAFDSRGTTWDIANRTSRPSEALENLLERDRMFTDLVAAEARELGLAVVPVDAGTTQDELVATVTRLFGLA